MYQIPTSCSQHTLFIDSHCINYSFLLRAAQKPPTSEYQFVTRQIKQILVEGEKCTISLDAQSGILRGDF